MLVFLFPDSLLSPFDKYVHRLAQPNAGDLVCEVKTVSTL